MNIRLRIVLPCVLGAISVLLVFWDIYNQRVISSMGMGWDTGAPVWPYQTPEILLYLLNYPAHYIAQPMANHLGLVTPEHHFLVFPTTLLLWGLFGLGLDHKLVWPNSRRPRLISAILLALAAVFLWASIIALNDAFLWWFQYGEDFWTSYSLLLVSKLAPAAWGFFLSLLLVVAARRAAFQ